MRDSEWDSAQRTWRRVARSSGYAVGICLLAGTVLYLLDALNVFGASPVTPHTAAGQLQDEASYWVALFAHQHHLLWDIVLRDTLLPIAFMALIVLGVAARALLATDRPEADLMATFFIVGGITAALSDLISLAGTDYWREGGWSAVPATSMVAAGRSAEALGALTRWPEAAGFVVLALGLACLGRLCHLHAGLPSRLAPFAYAEALLLVGIAVAGVAESNTPYDIFSLLTGALIGPLVAVWLGRHLSHITHIASSSP